MYSIVANPVTSGGVCYNRWWCACARYGQESFNDLSKECCLLSLTHTFLSTFTSAVAHISSWKGWRYSLGQILFLDFTLLRILKVLYSNNYYWMYYIFYFYRTSKSRCRVNQPLTRTKSLNFKKSSHFLIPWEMAWFR